MMCEKMNEVEIYTDGACRGNPGPGGWGVWMIAGDHEKELFGGDADTTNNPHGTDGGYRGVEGVEKTLQGDFAYR